MSAKPLNRKSMTLTMPKTLTLRISKWSFLTSAVFGMALFIALSGYGNASQYKTILNTFTGRFDFVNDISTGNVVSASSFRVVDTSNCLWNIAVNTSGNLVTTLVSCPAVVTFIPCTPGVPYGVLLSLTCPRP